MRLAAGIVVHAISSRVQELGWIYHSPWILRNRAIAHRNPP
jgi:hypothetical protein